MNTRPCPHCETGWRRADELPSAAEIGSRLVPCPSCGGSGVDLGGGNIAEFFGTRLSDSPLAESRPG